MTTFQTNGLTGYAIETLGQMFTRGPTWDGNIVSKSGRDELVRAGLAFHANGWASLTDEGIRTAVGWDRQYLRTAEETLWLEKLRRS